MRGAAQLLGRPLEVEGRGRRGRPARRDARLPDREPRARRAHLLVPAYGIYAGAGRSAPRAAVSIGVNPHYGGDERRIEAFLLDFEGDLYGRAASGVELWERLRDERAFESEDELVAQIAHDVAAARAATRP